MPVPSSIEKIPYIVYIVILLMIAGCSNGEQPSSVSAVAEAAAIDTPTSTATSASTISSTSATKISASAPTTVATATPAPKPTIDTVSPLSHTTNVLVLGSDRRIEARMWRTDVIMVVALDQANSRAAIISLPRDIYIDQVPNFAPNKINMVDFYGEVDGKDGGPKLLMGILEQKLGIKLHHFVRFEFESFKEVVDVLGGVDIEIECAYKDYNSEEDVTLDIQPGFHHFNGKEAISFVRSRTLGGDLDRARRQQQMIWAIRNRIKNTNVISKVPAIYGAVSDRISTDIGLLQVVQLSRYGLNLEPADIHGMVVQHPLLQESWRNGMFVFIADWKGIAAQAQKIFDTPPFQEVVKVGPNGERQSCPTTG